MADQPNSSARPSLHQLPDCPEIATVVAGTFHQLGGLLSIDSRGRRGSGRPEYPSMDEGGIPQLDGANAYEQFHNDDEWLGAMKLLQYWLKRLSPADRDFVYGMFAATYIDPDATFKLGREG